MQYSEEIVKQLETRLRFPLPGLDAQMKMAPKVRTRDYVIPDNARKGGVMLLLYPHHNLLNIALMKRAEDGGTHSGQISFPGGTVEKTDENMIHTALRETEEEIGVPAHQIRTLGSLTDLYIPPSNFIVYPCVGFIEQRPEFIPDEREVAEILEVPLHYLLQDGIMSIKKVQMSGNKSLVLDTPVYDIYGHTLWGATAMMMAEFLTIIKEIR
ncbi:MAG: CoA pyrophosphatase [Bacteroidia bacterium]|nr:CoA pyrophosphatase [Bacteroidia bacterium]